MRRSNTAKIVQWQVQRSCKVRITSRHPPCALPRSSVYFFTNTFLSATETNVIMKIIRDRRIDANPETFSFIWVHEFAPVGGHTTSKIRKLRVPRHPPPPQPPARWWHEITITTNFRRTSKRHFCANLSRMFVGLLCYVYSKLHSIKATL